MKAGLYIHIPFCRSKCLYCAFYSVPTREVSQATDYQRALLKEAAYFKARCAEKIQVQTLYIGGGTPSLLPVSFYAQLWENLQKFFDFSPLQEVSFEANPEHLSQEYLQDLFRYTPVRRLSIGVQSFSDADLKMLHRHHNAHQALMAIEHARKAGFENLSIDLIYGLHAQDSISTWKQNLQRLQSLQVPHFSAYALTVEEGTALEKKLSLAQMQVADEEQIEREYHRLQDFAAQNGYTAYEISNYAKEGAYAKHNCNYWRDVPYIGLGASAHSYIDNERHWNQSSVQDYIRDPIAGKRGETLSEEDRYHEYVMTALRTIWGIDKAKIDTYSDWLREKFYRRLENEIKCGNLQQIGNTYSIPADKRLLTDGIAASFF